MSKKHMVLKEFVKRYFVVNKCGGCGEILAYGHQDEGLCEDCRKRWNIARTETCKTCSQSAVECLCMPKGLSSAGALCLRKIFFYSPQKQKEPCNRLIYFLKKNRNRRVASFVASELRPLALRELDILAIDPSRETVLVSVPRGVRSRAVYGFDQSELLARELSRITGIPYLCVIKRKRGGREQKQLDRGRRFRNVRSLFVLTEPDGVKGKYVLLVDDVVTTGASMAACTLILKKVGAKGVICLCIAQD